MNKLIRKCAALRTSATRIISKFENEIKNPEPNMVIIDEILAQLKRKEELLSSIDNEIENFVDIENLEDEINVREDYAEKIIRCKTHANRILNSANVANNIDVTTENRSNIRAPNLESSPKIKLPRLVIETFDGNIMNWSSFWSQYETAVHKNPNLCDVDKFNYLKSFRSSDAKNLIYGLALMAENYEKAITILKNCYGQKELLIDAQMSKLLNLNVVKNPHDTANLRKLYDELEITMQNLESLEVKPDSYGCLLYPILVKVIPRKLALEFNRTCFNCEEAKISKLMDFLKAEVESRERTDTLIKLDKLSIANKNVESPYSCNQRTEKVKRHDQYKSSMHASAAALHTMAKETCIFCSDDVDHNSDECTKKSIIEKKEILKNTGRCFLCFKKFHLSKNCRLKIECSYCQKRHRKALCEKAYPVENSTEQTVVSSVVPNKNKNEGTSKQKIMLQTVRAIASGQTRKLNVRCLFDGGSQRSFIRKDLSRKLKLPVTGEETLNLHTFGNVKPVNTKLSRVKLGLYNCENKLKFIEIEALETPEICSALIQIPSKELIIDIESFNIKLSDSPKNEAYSQRVDILIGLDYYWEIVSGKLKRLSPSVMLIETLFGWSLQGPLNDTFLNEEELSTKVLNIMINNKYKDDALTSSQLKAFWEIDSLGINDESKINSTDDREALDKYESSIKFNGERYEACFPWKYSEVSLPDNYENAKRRFDNLVRRFKKDEELYDQYNTVISDYINLGIVEKVSEIEILGKTKQPIYYIPHQPVIRKDKETTKLRIVFDASSHPPDEPSLNDLLHSGPNLNPDLLNLLLRFRVNKIAFVADIEKAFLQISLSKDDRDVTRFLWMDDNTSLHLNSNFQPQVLRMARIPFGVTSSPFLLAAVIKIHIRKYMNDYPEAHSVLNNSMYVDDLISGASNIEEAYRLSYEVKDILLQAKMSLRKWQTNSQDLKELWKENDFNISESETSFEKQSIPFKVLGLVWDPGKDVFKFDVTNLLEFVIKADKTKRSIVKASGRIFDPIGFLSPYTVRIKLIFQELWERNIQWDENLPTDVEQKWNLWCKELPAVNTVQIPRYYFDKMKHKKVKEIQVHCFTDASEKAYGAVIYLRYKTQDNDTATAFLTSKSRIAPLKRLSIPRLELMGALIGARLINHLKENFQDFTCRAPVYFWTDSNIALAWIKSCSSKWKPFIGNRIKEIQSLSDSKSWRHCPGQENPADLLTRGKTIENFMDSYLWWSGPVWLAEDETKWPTISENIKISESHTSELRCKENSILISVSGEQMNEFLFDLKHYNRLSKVLRITAWIKRFIHNLKYFDKKKSGPLNATELNEAEKYWINTIQRYDFSMEVRSLLEGKDIPNTSIIKNFNPFIDSDGLIRVKGRLQFADLTYDEKHPILLSDKNELSNLLIRDCHEKVAHSGVASTLTQLRGKFWILRARRIIKNVINKCIICKKFRAKPMTETTAPQPFDRVKVSSAFEITGIDFAGPIYVKERNEIQKSYICLFTCATTRAVHLELITNLSTETFILAFKRFVSRRGLCNVIYSDNALTFKKADKEFQNIWKNIEKNKLGNYFGSQRIKWKFIAPRAAWWGGFWERMVRTVKTCLKKILGKALLKFEEMNTVLTEVEAIINSRPLTYTYNEVNEPLPLTPSHFLVGKRLIGFPTRNLPKITLISGSDLRKRLRYQQSLIENFWKKWKQQYLLELRCNHYVQNTKTNFLNIGDIVLVSEPKEPRHMWKMGRILELFKGRDGKIRSSRVQLSKRTVLKRPVQLLCPLELETSDDLNPETFNEATSGGGGC